MSKIYGAKDPRDSQAFLGNPAGSGELFPQGIRAGPGAGVHDANEGRSEGQMVDETGSGAADPRIEYAATLAAFSSYRAVYGHEIGIDFELILDALDKFWLDRFRQGGTLPLWLGAAENEKAADPGTDSAPAPGPHEALEKDGL